MLILTILISLWVIFLIYFISWWRNRKIIMKIPGPEGTWFFGHLLYFLSPLDELWIKVRKMSAAYYPIYQYWHLSRAAINLVSPEDMEVVLSSMKHSRKSVIYNVLHSWLGTGLLTSSGKKWQNRRKILTPAFHFNILQDFVGVFVEESELLIAELEEECSKPYTNIVPIITRFTLNTVCESAMGTKLERTKQFSQEYTNAIYRMGEIVLLRLTRPWYLYNISCFFTSVYGEQKRIVKKLHSFTMSVIEKRKFNFDETTSVINSTGQDEFKKKRRLAMLDLLISAKNSQQAIDDEGIREEVDTFMFEGHDTTTACLSFTLLLLACHQAVQDSVFQEIQEMFGDSKEPPTIHELQNLTYLDRVLKESLRLYPSVPFISRVTDETIVTPTGYVIPADTILQLHIYDMHHNPNIYPDPEKFDPDRFLPENVQKRHPFAYIPFSAGPRNCIGQKFALIEIKIALVAILRRFRLESVDTPSTITMITHLVLKTKNGIKIKFRKRYE